MRLFKDKYDLTLDEVSLMFEKQQTSVLKRFRWLPDWLTRFYYDRFALQFNEQFNGDLINKMLDVDIMKLKLVNLLNNFLPTLYQGLMATNEDPDSEAGIYFRQLYRKRYAREYNGMEDLKMITADMKKLGIKLREIVTDQPKRSGEGMLFEDVIAHVEAILERSIPRDMKLYQFSKQYELALQRAKTLEQYGRH